MCASVDPSAQAGFSSIFQLVGPSACQEGKARGELRDVDLNYRRELLLNVGIIGATSGASYFDAFESCACGESCIAGSGACERQQLRTRSLMLEEELMASLRSP